LGLIITDERKRFQQQNYTERFGSENREVAICIQRLKSSDTLSALLDGLGNDFLTFASLRDFEDTLTIVFTNIEQFLQEGNLVRKVIVLFKANASYILNTPKASVAFLTFFRVNDLLNGIAAEVVEELAPDNASAISTVSFLASRNTMDLLLEEKKAGKISEQLKGSLEHFFKINHNPELDYFRKIFEIAVPEEKPGKPYALIEADRQKRDLAALFNEQKFKEEVNLLFDGFGKDDISYADLDYSNPDYWSEKYCSIVREILEIRPSSPSLNRQNVRPCCTGIGQISP